MELSGLELDLGLDCSQQPGAMYDEQHCHRAQCVNDNICNWCSFSSMGKRLARCPWMLVRWLVRTKGGTKKFRTGLMLQNACLGTVERRSDQQWNAMTNRTMPYQDKANCL